MGFSHTHLVSRPRLRQPWVFVYYAVGFGVLTYVIQDITVRTAVVGGIGFALLMSIWRELRLRRAHSGA